MTRMIDDEIVEEIRRRRQAHAESLGYDLRRITEDIQRQERDSGALLKEMTPTRRFPVPDWIAKWRDELPAEECTLDQVREIGKGFKRPLSAEIIEERDKGR